MPRVMILTNRDTEGGIIFDGIVEVDLDSYGPFATDALKELRYKGFDIQDGDCMFFPEAAGTHRVVEVRGKEFSRLHGWGV